jgi:hypothetical protein
MYWEASEKYNNITYFISVITFYDENVFVEITDMNANANQISLLPVQVHHFVLWLNHIECFSHVVFVLL